MEKEGNSRRVAEETLGTEHSWIRVARDDGIDGLARCTASVFPDLARNERSVTSTQHEGRQHHTTQHLQ